MKKIFLILMLGFLIVAMIFTTASMTSKKNTITVQENEQGMKLVVNGKDFMINGMNWDYFPIGTNYTYNLWNQSDDFIKAALDAEMTLLKNMGVNTIRVYTGIQPRWITYIHKNYGIYTMLNHSFGRYGVTIDGVSMQNTEYGNPKVKEHLINAVKQMANEYKDTSGLLMYMLGNENNYGLSWEGAETDNIPAGEDATIRTRARAMYKLFNEATLAIKTIDMSHPVAICNGDLLYLDLVIEECPDIDIYGTNMYRGISFGDAFNRVKKELGKPIMFAEFGADAFNAREHKEDQHSQAYYMTGNWKEIYKNAAGLGKAENAIGGFTFQFSDGWWKRGQTKNLDVHNTEASWNNEGYAKDSKSGINNMNEEWFGVCAKGPNNDKGLYKLYPRAAYYALQEVHKFNPYGENITQKAVTRHFHNIQLTDAVQKAKRK